ncbi:HD domain-containing phosphohydrolase [Candidatus Magnetobacterium casense]|uniref:GAF domain-containing protein n=1 Tax=Candidatus Magnetobacterium casense TaxID=1455061 RepID=A0ABS6S336_9BACT|nr:HD domain-containing phosphohydrolase [Candidatus Magnetobacterium casensis]MBV6343057.1 GAF domain-containing protein [Candidatus Magnetobacterium casensis]
MQITGDARETIVEDNSGTPERQLQQPGQQQGRQQDAEIARLQALLAQKSHLASDLLKIGTALSAEKNIEALLEMIVVEAMKLTNSDGATLYIKTPDETAIAFKILQNRTLALQMGGTSDKAITFPPLKLYKPDGTGNKHLVSVYVALTGTTLNIPDVYEIDGFDFQGCKDFDKNTCYRSKSMLVTALKNYENEIIGVLQLINAQDSEGGIIPFSVDHQELIESLASQAAVAITNASLLSDLKNLMDGFIKSIASAIDEKSPYTGGHIRRVAEITLDIAQGLNSSNDGRWKDFSLSQDEINELRIAAWMHDIGKISTPEYVVDKATKLETIYDRIHYIEAKFEILIRDIELFYLKKHAEISSDNNDDKQAHLTRLREVYDERINSLASDLNFLRLINQGGEFMSDALIARLKDIATTQITLNGVQQNLLTENEVYNLSIRKGTLTEEERNVIQNHVVLTHAMLARLPWPKKLRGVCEYAGEHHEKLDGTGYPNGLDADSLSVQSRIIAIADIFEALSAGDRPYKHGKKLSECIKIINMMVKDNHVDKDIVDFFIRSGLLQKYARRELKDYQIDPFTYNGVTYDFMV